MTQSLSEIFWWMQVIELPVMAALFLMILKTRDALAAYKLEVAHTYASLSYIAKLEGHLIRIERKLDDLPCHKPGGNCDVG